MNDIIEPSTKPKPFVFVVMPFSKEFDDVYQLGIKAACTEAGAYCERLDERVFDEGVLDQIYIQIAKADMIVADMSNQNANVFYEVGYAHALDKRVILITNSASDIPFDLKHRFHIVYEKSIATLKTKLRERIAWYVENPTNSKIGICDHLQIHLGGNQLGSSDMYWSKEKFYEGRVGWELEFAVHNPPDAKLGSIAFTPSLICPNDLLTGNCDFYIRLTGDIVNLPQDRSLLRHDSAVIIEPGGWHNLSFFAVPKYNPPKIVGKAFGLTLRLLNDGPPTDISFEVTFKAWR